MNSPSVIPLAQAGLWEAGISVLTGASVQGSVPCCGFAARLRATCQSLEAVEPPFELAAGTSDVRGAWCPESSLVLWGIAGESRG